MSRLSLPTELINKVLFYLSERPYKESCILISELKQQAKPVEEKEEKEDKPPKLQEVKKARKEANGKSHTR